MALPGCPGSQVGAPGVFKKSGCPPFYCTMAVNILAWVPPPSRGLKKNPATNGRLIRALLSGGWYPLPRVLKQRSAHNGSDPSEFISIFFAR